MLIRAKEMVLVQYKLDEEEKEEGDQWVWSISENEALAITLGIPENVNPKDKKR